MTTPARPRPTPSQGAALVLAAALAAAGCARQPDQMHANAAERAACGKHADTVYNMRYPDEVYRSDTIATSTRDAPFAGAGTVSDPSQGLTARYERAQLVSDCLNGGEGTVGAAPEAPPPEETPTAIAKP
jgi:hypothetical protein